MIEIMYHMSGPRWEKGLRLRTIITKFENFYDAQHIFLMGGKTMLVYKKHYISGLYQGGGDGKSKLKECNNELHTCVHAWTHVLLHVIR